MDKIRIGNDIHIEWLIFRNNQPEVFEGKDVEVRLMHTRTRDVMPLDWVISEGVVSATFYGKDQINTGDYKLMLVENNGAPNMATIDECKAFTLVQCSCQERKEEPSTSLQLHKVQLASSFALSGGGNINVEGYPNVDELEEVKELSGNENIIITDSEGNKKTTISNLKEYVVKDISELPPFRIFETESDYNAVKDELGDCVVCLRDTGVMLYHVKKVEDEGEGEDKYIRFADPEVQRILVENFSADKVGMTSDDIAKVTSIGTAFKGNTTIESFDEFEKFIGLTKIAVNIPYNYGVFANCTNLRSIKMPMYLKEIEQDAFSNTPALVADISAPHLMKIGHAAFHASGIQRVSDLGSITSLPDVDNYNKIGVFSYSKSLEYVNIPKTVTSIGRYSFCEDTMLSDLGNIQWGNITAIGTEAFYNCTSLEIEDLQLPNLETLGQNAFFGVKIKKISNLGKLTALQGEFEQYQIFGDKSYLESIVLPNSLTTIARNALYGYSNATCNIPQSITTLGQTSLRKMAKLVVDVDLPNLAACGEGVFSQSGIRSIKNLGSITAIPTTYDRTWGFCYSCNNLEYAVLSANITAIGNYAFLNCSKLKEVILRATTPPTLGSEAFNGTPIASGTGTIYVPDASVEAYKTATNWSQYSSRIKGLSELSTDNPDLYNEIKDYL